MVTKGGRVVRTESLRVALNDLRSIRNRDGHGADLPARVVLDDGTGTTLHVEPFMATDETEGYDRGVVVPGVFTVTRRDALDHRVGRVSYIP